MTCQEQYKKIKAENSGVSNSLLYIAALYLVESNEIQDNLDLLYEMLYTVRLQFSFGSHFCLETKFLSNTQLFFGSTMFPNQNLRKIGQEVYQL